MQVNSISETAVRAMVTCERIDEQRHELGPEVKAVTYHQLLVAQESGQWHARVLLDL
jgi:SHS2 domain-containing protein